MSKVYENTAKTSTIAVLKKTEFLGKTLTVFGTVATPLFLAKEIADWLEHSDTSKMIASVDADEKCLYTNPNNLRSGGQNAWFLTEYGLYEVLMQSRKPIAKEFKKGVKKILSEIRTIGYYTNNLNPNTDLLHGQYRWAMDALNRQNEQIAWYQNFIIKLEEEITELKAIQSSNQKALPIAPISTNAPKKQPKKQNKLVLHAHTNSLCGRPFDVFVHEIEQKPTFLLLEVARYITNSQRPSNLKNYVSEENRFLAKNPCKIFGGTDMWFITEKGLEELVNRYSFAYDLTPFKTAVNKFLKDVRNGNFDNQTY